MRSACAAETRTGSGRGSTAEEKSCTLSTRERKAKVGVGVCMSNALSKMDVKRAARECVAHSDEAVLSCVRCADAEC